MDVSGVDDSPLGKQDLLDIESAIIEVAARWRHIGGMFQLSPGTLDTTIWAHHSDAKACLREMILKWLRKSGYDHQQYGPPTWRWVVEAVASPAGGDNQELARRIAAHHPKGSGTVRHRHQSIQMGGHPHSYSDISRIGEGRTARQILEEALEKGYVLCSIIKVLTLGAAGSGKTCTKFCMLRENPPITRCSTPLTEAAIRAISRVLIGTDLTGWFRVSYEELMSMLAKALKAGVPMEAKEQHGAMRAGVQQLWETLQRFWKVKKASSPSLQPSRSSEELVRLVEQSSGSKRFFEIQWINFIDSGGQPQFHELLPAFIRNANVIMFVLKLSERLDEQPMIEYYEKGRHYGDAQPCILRNDQILQHCIRTMRSCPSPSGEERQCRVMMVGTHRDLESQCTETRAEKNEKILQMFEPDELVFNHPFTEVIFPLNAKEPTKDDRQVVSKICKKISDIAPKPSKVPIGWFLLEQDIKKLASELGRGVLSMEECLDLATRLKINNEALKAALNYLDELNILLYYPSLLPNVLFAEPQALVTKSSELVAFNYKLRCEQISEALTGEWKRFRDEGVVTLRMLEDERFSCHYAPKLFTPSDLIKLFSGLLIFAPLTTDEYFMPSLLPMIPGEEIKRYCPPPSSTVAPLLVHFPSKCAPNGIYCALVVHLLSVCKWKLLYQTGCSPACVSRNCICFRIPGKPATVSLVDSFSFFEVHVETSSTKILHQIGESVFAGLENASHTLKYYDLKPVEAFFCGCGAPPHSATPYIDGEDRCLVCTQTSKRRPLCRKHAVWLGEQSSVCTPSALPSPSPPSSTTATGSGTAHPRIGNRPEMWQLQSFVGVGGRPVRVVENVCADWENLALALQFRGGVIRAVERSQQFQVRAACLTILHRWLDGEGRQPVTWETLVECLEDIGHSTLASDLRRELVQESLPSPPPPSSTAATGLGIVRHRRQPVQNGGHPHSHSDNPRMASPQESRSRMMCLIISWMFLISLLVFYKLYMG